MDWFGVGFVETLEDPPRTGDFGRSASISTRRDGMGAVLANGRQNQPTEVSPEVIGTTILPPDPFASSLSSLSHTSLSHTLA